MILVAMFLAHYGSSLGQSRPMDTPSVEEAIVADQLRSEQCAETAELSYVISRFDNVMRKVGEEQGLDWRLMSAIAYSESRFIENLKSNRELRVLCRYALWWLVISICPL